MTEKQNRNVLKERIQNILNLHNSFLFILNVFKLCFENVLKHLKISVGLFFWNFLFFIRSVGTFFNFFFFQNLMLECFLSMFWKHFKFIHLKTKTLWKNFWNKILIMFVLLSAWCVKESLIREFVFLFIILKK